MRHPFRERLSIRIRAVFPSTCAGLRAKLLRRRRGISEADNGGGHGNPPKVGSRDSVEADRRHAGTELQRGQSQSELSALLLGPGTVGICGARLRPDGTERMHPVSGLDRHAYAPIDVDAEHTVPGMQMLLYGDTATRFQLWAQSAASIIWPRCQWWTSSAWDRRGIPVAARSPCCSEPPTSVWQQRRLAWGTSRT
jgi:hypothetical protein